MSLPLCHVPGAESFVSESLEAVRKSSSTASLTFTFFLIDVILDEEEEEEEEDCACLNKIEDSDAEDSRGSAAHWGHQ